MQFKLNIQSAILNFLLATLLSTLFSCESKKAEQSNVEAESQVEPSDKNQVTSHDAEELTLSLTQYQAVKIETGLVEMRNLNSVVKANGYTSVPPQNNANASSLIGGIIQDIYILEGTYVNKGKVLASIKNLEVIAMQEDYKTANANIEYLELEYQRQKTLSDENVSAKKIFQEVKSKLAVERAKAQAAKSKLDALHVNPNSNSAQIPILAPISGYIGKIHINKGGYAEVGKALFEIVDNSQMHLDLNVYEKDLFKIKEGQTVDVVLTNQQNKSIKATIFGINKSFSNESKTVAVHSKINSSDVKGLIAGMYVTANINISDAFVQALPKEAVVKDGEKYFIFQEIGIDERVVEEEGEHQHINNDAHTHGKDGKVQKKEKIVRFKSIEVIPGTTDLGYTEISIIDELPSDAKIVTQGAFYLLSSKIGGGDHEH
ncbi:MAG: efflux RND transporter periplasmic adaptor subunit [Bacteroidetes bacterium]|nr:efflux RND transporter periplasmic adaptor subunit [Bacteroidota bacterium]